MRRAEGCQHSSDHERLDMTAAVAKQESAPAVEAAIPVDNPVSKNN